MDEERLIAAIKIALKPSLYKVCEGCDSILNKDCLICPNCKSYRFDCNESSVINMAEDLSKKEQKTVTEKDLY